MELDEGEDVIFTIDDLGPESRVQLQAFGRRRDCQAQGIDVEGDAFELEANNQESSTRLQASCGNMTGQDTYTWRVPSTGRFTFDTTGSEFDTVLEVLTDGCGLESLGCNDDAHETTQSELTLDLVEGQALTIVVGGFRRSRGEYTLRVRPIENVPGE